MPSRSITPVHPRIRGERTMLDSGLARVIGSSPHTRGTRVGEALSVVHERFIPAYAGNACI